MCRKNIVIFAIGTRGDVQPSILLGVSLMQRGHTVHIATEVRLRALVEEFGLPWRCIEGDKMGMLFNDEVQAALGKGSLFPIIRQALAWADKFDERAILASYESAATGADILVGSALSLTGSLSIAQARGLAYAALMPFPMWPTNEFPPWMLASIMQPCALAARACPLYRWSYFVLMNMLWRVEHKVTNAWRVESLGQKPWPCSGLGAFDLITSSQAPVLVAASEVLCGLQQQVPADFPPHVRVGGFLFAADVLSDAVSVDPKLAKFMAVSGAPPVICFDFGSMPATQPEHLLQIGIDTCKQLGCRCVLVTGWSSLGNYAKCSEWIESAAGAMLVVHSAPHDWLFPRCAAVVHHCGVGTMASALRSGVPQVPVAVMFDQPHNAKLCVALGVAPGWLSFPSLSSKRLMNLLKMIWVEPSHGPMHQASLAASERIRKESVGCAKLFCEMLETAQPLKPQPLTSTKCDVVAEIEPRKGSTSIAYSLILQPNNNV